MNVDDVLERVAEAEEDVHGYTDGDSLERDMKDFDIDWFVICFEVLFIHGEIILDLQWLQHQRSTSIYLFSLAVENEVK